MKNRLIIIIAAVLCVFGIGYGIIKIMPKEKTEEDYIKENTQYYEESIQEEAENTETVDESVQQTESPEDQSQSEESSVPAIIYEEEFEIDLNEGEATSGG